MSNPATIAETQNARHGGILRWVGFCLCFAAPLFAQTPSGETNGPPPPPAQTTVATVTVPPAIVILYNQPLVVFRGPLYGYSPTQRARSAEQRLARFIAEGTLGPITTQPTSDGVLVLLDGEKVFMVTPGDLDSLAGETMDAAVRTATTQLESVLKTIREESSWKHLLRATGGAVALTVLFVGILRLEVRFWHWLRPRLERTQHRWKLKSEKKGLFMFVEATNHVVRMGRLALGFVAVLLTYEWLAIVLRLFPYTRPWGEHMAGYLLAALRPIAGGMFHWLPDLFVIAFIVVIAKVLVWLVRRLTIGVRSGRISASWLDADTAKPTSRILIVIIWLFAVVMVYPYLPGSQSAGFRSVAVFVGLLVSLGATGVIGQILGGFVLMYTRTLKTGEYVRVGEQEGTVESIGFLSTRLRTPRNEMINIPNAVLMATTTTNYSRLAATEGVMASTKVTIGYDTPWRQVHALLLRAAEKTTGLKKPPEPFVWQRALGDFNVEYELNVCVEDPEQRLPVLSALCGHLQDEFNAHGVQIMSPHFMANPPEKVWVPKEKWHEPPAVREPSQK